MNRLAGIITAAVGFVIAVLSVTKVVPGLTSAGVLLILLGGLVIGLSFVDRPNSENVERMSTPATLVNIFVAPREVFGNLRRHPRWLVAMIIMSVLAAVYGNLFLYRIGTERVANYAIDKTLEMSFLNEEARAQIEKGRAQAVADAKNPVMRLGQVVSGFSGRVMGIAFLALIFFLFALALGGKINYWQSFAATTYAFFPVSVISFVLNSIVLFIKDPADVHPITGQTSLIQDNLGFLFTPSENPVLYTIASMIGLLWIYWIWLNAIGLNTSAEKASPSYGWISTLTVYVCIVLLASVSAFLFPSFLS